LLGERGVTERGGKKGIGKLAAIYLLHGYEISKYYDRVTR